MAEIAKFQSRKKSAAKCPICGRPPEGKYKPFCSHRCAEVDLSRWLGEVYRVPTDEKPEDAVTAEPEPDVE